MHVLTRPRVWIATAFASASLFTAAVPASAQQIGLVNVDIGDVNVLNHVGVGLAAQVAANLCGVQVPVAAILAAARAGQGVVCETDQGPVTISNAA